MKRILLGIILVGLVTSFGYCKEKVDSEKYLCEIDKDCILFEPNCCRGCSPSSSVNKSYLDDLKSERDKKCASFTDECPQVECMPIAYEAYCNEKKVCDKRIDCNRTCELMEISGFDFNYAKEHGGCSCENLIDKKSE